MNTVDQAKLEAFLGQGVGDLGAALSGALVVLGDRLGLYKAMADGKPITPGELARRTGTNERYVSEWLCAQAAGGYCKYDPATRRFHLPAEQATAPADEASPAYMVGGFSIAGGCSSSPSPTTHGGTWTGTSALPSSRC
jgi:hypothetical protein